MSLQIVFILVSVWGWTLWFRGGSGPDVMRVTRLSRQGLGLSVFAWLAGFVVLAWFLRSLTDTDVPHVDGFLTAGSLLGQVLLSRKKLENWHVWIIVDILYVGLYVYKNLILTALLYALFVVMAMLGLRVWRKTCQA